MKVWTREESKERFPKPISPLGWSLLHVPMQATLSQMAKTLGGKQYSPQELMFWHNYHVYTRKGFFKSIGNIKLKPTRFLYLLFSVLKSFSQELFRTPFTKGPLASRFSQRLFLSLFGEEIRTMVQAWAQDLESLKQMMGRPFGLDGKHSITHEEFVKIRQQMQEDSKVYFAEDFNVYFFKHLLSSLLQSQLVRAGISKEKAGDLLNSLSNGLEDNFSIRMIKDFGDVKISTEELKKSYGHLTDNWDLLNPVFAEQENLWTHRQLPSLPQKERQERNYDALQEIGNILSWNARVSELILWYQKLILMDEDLRAYSSLQYPQARALMSSVEQTTAWKELRLAKDAVYFLSLEEIEMGLKNANFATFKDQIEERQKGFAEALKSIPPFEFTQEENGKIVYPAAALKANIALTGTCVSTGSVTGTVTFVRGYEDLSQISRNSVLVLESATPVFSPFYAVCGGIISEVGGHLSHGAIVARECGIPMLTGVENACGVLLEGQEIFLDADQGLIKVIR